MKKNIKFLSVFLSMILGSTTLLSACNQEETIETVDTVTPVAYTEGVHDFTAPERDDYLVKNGTTEYQLVIPENAGTYTAFAQSEFVWLFEEATNITISTVTESGDGLTHSESAKYISIGNTKMLESAGLEAKASELGSQGVRIETKDDTIYLFGGGPQSPLYAVYDFMQIMFDYEIYYYDVWEINKNVKNVKMRKFNVTDIPDIEIRCPSFGPVRSNTDNLGYRFRQPLVYNQYILPAGDEEHGQSGQSIHNSNNILPKEYWGNVHPKWYASDDSLQLCYTAHGDPEEYEAMLTQVTNVMISSLKRYSVQEHPNYEFIGLMIEDDKGFCGCDACANALNLYGANAGVVIKFCNSVMERVQTEMAKEENAAYYRENLKLLFFAYNKTLDAPAIYDVKTGKYVATHPDVVLRSDVGVFYAISSGINFAVSIYDDLNDAARANLEKWSTLANNGGGLYYWTYCAQFASYQVVNDTFNHFDSVGYQYYISNSAKMFYNQGEYQNKDCSNFDGLKAYLDYKLQWNCTLNTEELIDKWFNAMYGAVAPMMKELWIAQRQGSLLSLDSIGKLVAYSMYSNVYTTNATKYATLLNYLDACNAIEAYAYEIYAKYEPQKYETIKRNIDMEWAPIAYLLLSLYADTHLPTERLDSIKTYFYGLENELGALQATEKSSSNIFAEIKSILG